MMLIKKIYQVIKKNKTFLLTTHVNPDPDALCSELAMAEYLRALGKKVHIVNYEAVPSRYLFFPGARRIKAYKEGQRLKYDVAIVMDAGDISRVGPVRHLIVPPAPVINIDHHITNTKFGTLDVVFPKASSTTEVLYEFFKTVKHPLTKTMALCLYAGIMTDTGSFRYENTTSRTHAVAADLLSFGFSVDDLHRRLYEGVLLRDMELFAKVMNRFEVVLDSQAVYFELTKAVVAGFSEGFDLKATILKFLRSIKGAKVFIIFTEDSPQKTRVNFRSTGRIDAAKLACFFGGGGHKRASGCTITKGLKDAKKDVLKKVRTLL